MSVVSILLLSFLVTYQVEGAENTSGTTAPGYTSCDKIRIIHHTDEEGTDIPFVPDHTVGGQYSLDTTLTNLAKSIKFRIQIIKYQSDSEYEQQEGGGGSLSDPLEEETQEDDLLETSQPNLDSDRYAIEFGLENSANWKVTCKILNQVKVIDSGISLELTSEGDTASIKRINKQDQIEFILPAGEVANLEIEIFALSSVSPGDQMEMFIKSGDSSECGEGVLLSVEVGMEEDFSIFWIIGVFCAVIGLLFAIVLYKNISKKEVKDEKVKEISDLIFKGAMTFLNKEYRILAIFSVVVVIILLISATITPSMSYWTPVTFIVGAIFSAVAGNIGMRIATAANGKTAEAVKKDMRSGLKIAFSSGAVMGLCVVSLGLLGISIFYLLFKDPNILFGFGFGASSIALFARVGGGIYTKSADVGADLVGKVEKDIPEDDPRNPAVIADNVGDNVGDVAGMGADLFESYVDSIIAAMILGIVGIGTLNGAQDMGGVTGKAVLLPMIIAGIGIISSIIGITMINNTKKSKSLHGLLNSGLLTASLFQGVASLLVIVFWMGFDYLEIWGAMVTGLVAGLVIGYITEYYTSDEFGPTRGIAKASQTGSAPNIIEGLAVGMISTVVPVVMVCVALIVSFWLVGLYGIAIAAVGMLSTLGITLATDSYGPVADNAAGIAEMAGMGKVVRERAERLDAVGNTTAAIGKGFAIGSAALTGLALFSTYTLATHLSFSSLSLMDPYVIAGIFIGGLLVFVFSALTMKAVGKAAMEMVQEVRRQFSEIKGLMQGKVQPEYNKCISIATEGALKQMILPSLLAVATPVLVGLILGPEALGGLLGGALVCGFMMAVMMANSGGAWDNAKKYVEAGNLGGKGSSTHKASVVGDTVGDPFKDTSGPSLNILIKLMSIVSLVFAPLFLLFH